MPVVGMPVHSASCERNVAGGDIANADAIAGRSSVPRMFSIGDITLLFGGILVVAICFRRTLERRRQDVQTAS